MYSVVMMMMMSTTPDAVAFGHRGGHGCCGCQGYSAGCGCEGGRRHHFGHRHHGCCGNDHGCGCSGYSSCGCDSCGGGCGNGYGCGGYNAGCGCGGGGMMMPPMMPPGGPQGPGPNAPKAGEGGHAAAAPASIMVSLPSDAKVYFDGTLTNSPGEKRAFETPALAAGTEITYTLTAEIVRDGRNLTASRIITVRAGETTEVNLGADSFAMAFARN